MKQLTVRKVDQDLHNGLKRQARQHGISVNRYVLHVLKQAVGLSKNQQQPRIWHDLDHLAGTWTLEQASEFGLYMNEQRDIDERLWS
jgi:plasmid stability protein